MSTAIVVRDIVKEFPVGANAIRVLHGIDVTVRTGSVTVVRDSGVDDGGNDVAGAGLTV